MAGSGRSRKWQVTINNPVEKGYSHEVIRQKMDLFKGCVYWCMCDEIGENGTFHTHLYFVLNNASKFETVKERFEGGHFEIANGTSQQNRDYIRKEGQHAKGKKKETNLPDTFEEWGNMPVERQGARNDLHDLYDMIKGGMSNFEIIESCPDYMMNIDKIERVRQIIRENKYKSVFRNMEVTYIWGKAGAGKTRGVMEKYGYENVFRVTDYAHPFDNYAGQEVVLFDEFYSSGIKIAEMLNYLDGYPLELPCRYANKIACFEKVYIVSNIPLTLQYSQIQVDHPETWRALLRRIHRLVQFSEEGQREYSSIEDWETGKAELRLTPKAAREVEGLFNGGN